MSFDSYYKWLGIPPEEQPPNHYRLLGLSPFEGNRDAIDNAADRQMGHVRTFQAGPQGADSQRLLNEIAAARVVLLDVAKKWAYDEQLRVPATSLQPMVVAVPASAMPASPAPGEIPPTTGGAIRVQPREPSAVARRPSKDMTIEIAKIVGGGIAGIVLATVLLRLGFGIDMTGLFPATPPEPPPSVVQRPKKVVPRKTQEVAGSVAANGEAKLVEPTAEEMEEYDEQTPGGVVKKKKKRKPKKKQSPSSVPIIEATPAFPDSTSPPGETPSELPAKAPAGDPTWRVSSASLMPSRLPPPSDAERQAAEQQLEQVYQLSKLEDQAAKLSKAAELLALGRDRAAKPAERWTLLKAAAELAADGGDARIVAQAMNVLSQTFDSDFLPDEASLLARSGRDVRSAAQMDALVQVSRLTIQLALAEQQFTLARDLAAAVREASNRPAGAAYRKFIYDGQKELVRQQKEWYDCQSELAKLAAKPDDPIASANVAKWWILERGDWDAALPFLAKAGDPLVTAAVDRDRGKGSDRLAIANAWFDAGTAGDGSPLWLVRAQEWYVAIDKAQVSGLDGAFVDRRLEELRLRPTLQPLIEQIHRGRGAARTSKQLAPVVRRHCMLLMPLDEADHFHDGKNWLVTDRSGQFNHGTVHGARPAPGQAGLALDFDGPDDSVECPDQPSLNPTEAISVCAWLRQRTVQNPGGADDVLSKEEWGGGTGRGFALRIDESRPKFNFGNGPDWLWAQAKQSPGLDTWYHLAAVYDGWNLVLLVNGVEVGVQPTNKSISISPQPLRIGRGPFAQDRRFDGTIDEAAVFDMALTAADLQAVIDLGRAGKALAK